MQNILVFAGAKQAGKSTAAKYTTGTMMLRASRLKRFKIDNNGDLIVNAAYRDSNNNLVEADGVLDLYRQDYDFLQYAEHNIWPYTKIYSFATLLKNVSASIFGLDSACLFGTNEQKDQFTHITWASMFKFMTYDEQCRYIEEKQISNPETHYLTYREFLQEFGTRICRGLMNSCWINALFQQIRYEGYPYVVIDDCRYANEVEFCKNAGASVIYLTNNPFTDTHSGENELKNMPESTFDIIIRNDKNTVSLEEKNKMLDESLSHLGWIKLELT